MIFWHKERAEFVYFYVMILMGFLEIKDDNIFIGFDLYLLISYLSYNHQIFIEIKKLHNKLVMSQEYKNMQYIFYASEKDTCSSKLLQSISIITKYIPFTNQQELKELIDEKNSDDDCLNIQSEDNLSQGQKQENLQQNQKPTELRNFLKGYYFLLTTTNSMNEIVSNESIFERLNIYSKILVIKTDINSQISLSKKDSDHVFDIIQNLEQFQDARKKMYKQFIQNKQTIQELENKRELDHIRHFSQIRPNMQANQSVKIKGEKVNVPKSLIRLPTLINCMFQIPDFSPKFTQDQKYIIGLWPNNFKQKFRQAIKKKKRMYYKSWVEKYSDGPKQLLSEQATIYDQSLIFRYYAHKQLHYLCSKYHKSCDNKTKKEQQIHFYKLAYKICHQSRCQNSQNQKMQKQYTYQLTKQQRQELIKQKEVIKQLENKYKCQKNTELIYEQQNTFKKKIGKLKKDIDCNDEVFLLNKCIKHDKSNKQCPKLPKSIINQQKNCLYWKLSDIQHKVQHKIQNKQQKVQQKVQYKQQQKQQKQHTNANKQKKQQKQHKQASQQNSQNQQIQSLEQTKLLQSLINKQSLFKNFYNQTLTQQYRNGADKPKPIFQILWVNQFDKNDNYLVKLLQESFGKYLQVFLFNTVDQCVQQIKDNRLNNQNKYYIILFPNRKANQIIDKIIVPKEKGVQSRIILYCIYCMDSTIGSKIVQENSVADIVSVVSQPDSLITQIQERISIFMDFVMWMAIFIVVQIIRKHE